MNSNDAIRALDYVSLGTDFFRSIVRRDPAAFDEPRITQALIDNIGHRGYLFLKKQYHTHIGYSSSNTEKVHTTSAGETHGTP